MRSFNLYRRVAAQFQIRYVAYGEDGSAACRRLASEGRCLVEQRYGWDALADRFDTLIREIAGGACLRANRKPIIAGSQA